MLTPDLPSFLELAAAGKLVPVRREFLFDVDTAVTAYAKLARPPFGFLLESVEGGETWARYTFLGTAPRAAWRLHSDGTTSQWSPEGGWTTPAFQTDPLAQLDQLLRARAVLEVPDMPRFVGGAVGYFGYDVVRYMERLPDAPPDDRGLPDALFVFTDVVLAIDNLFGRAHAIALVDTQDADEASLRTRYDAAAHKLDAVVRDLAQPSTLQPLQHTRAAPQLPVTSPTDRDDYENAVRRVQEYIAAGDAFQVVLSRRTETALRTAPFDLYRRLRSLNPSPYLFFLELDGIALVGSSPEALVRLEDGRVIVRPIAGTRARGATPADDARLAQDLAADPKEHAEHLMLLDLARNDVGRVAKIGSVRVVEQFTIEKYSHLQHISSHVEGTLEDGLDAIDALKAGFPAGTLSGAPKVRAMEIIDEVEPVRRGIYAGCAGYFAANGSMDTCIMLRTGLVKDNTMYVQAGVGVVADSDLESEFQESVLKARALVRAAEEAVRFANAGQWSAGNIRR